MPRLVSRPHRLDVRRTAGKRPETCVDLRRDREVLWIDKYYPVWVVFGILCPAAIAGLIGGDLPSFLRGALWGGFVRVFAVQHSPGALTLYVICSVMRPSALATKAEITLHARCFRSARAGITIITPFHIPLDTDCCGQLDTTYALIRLGEKLGLIWDVKVADVTRS